MIITNNNNDINGNIREVVKTTLHARDPLLRGEGREETMALPGLLMGGNRE